MFSLIWEVELQPLYWFIYYFFLMSYFYLRIKFIKPTKKKKKREERKVFWLSESNLLDELDLPCSPQKNANSLLKRNYSFQLIPPFGKLYHFILSSWILNLIFEFQLLLSILKLKFDCSTRTWTCMIILKQGTTRVIVNRRRIIKWPTKKEKKKFHILGCQCL